MKLIQVLGPGCAKCAKLKENAEAAVQEAGVEALLNPDGAAALLSELRRRRDTAANRLATIPGLRCPTPEATFYLFPNVTEAMAAKGFDDVAEFATAALHDTGVSFCTRRHFGRPGDDEAAQYIRLAYSGISVDDIDEGLTRLSDWITHEHSR